MFVVICVLLLSIQIDGETTPLAQWSVLPSMVNILSELSWGTKVKLIAISNEDVKILRRRVRKVNWDMSVEKAAKPPRMKVDAEEMPAFGSVNMVPPIPQRRQTQEPSTTAPTTTTTAINDEASMKLKLFRLMYETVRDSDLKVKRAELIKRHYLNSTVFELGYLMGDITDKYNVIKDISGTLKRLYSDWKPIEHINAYEQISNEAIEINHLVDMVRNLQKPETE